MRIGIDFDNTLARYDSVFTMLAQEYRLIGPDEVQTKQGVRALARQRDELLWQRMQGEVYGPRMQQAEQFEGVDGFLRAVRPPPTIARYFTSSVLGDQAACVGAVEQEYRKLWQEWRTGKFIQNVKG